MESPASDLPGLSRRLAQDGLLIGEIRIHQWVGSTNDDLLEQAGLGAGDWDVAVAEAQSGGRGRRGRRWLSPYGLNLYMSVLLPRMGDPAQGPRLPLMAAVAAAEVMEDQGLSGGLKWPNDLIAPSGAKLAGLLVEQASDGRAVIGWGLNVNADSSQLVPGSASLHTEFGGTWDRAALATGFVGRLQAGWQVLQAEAFGPVARAWQRRALWLGQEVRVIGETGEWAGRMEGVDDWGRLRLATEWGEQRLSAGEVSLRAR